MWSQFWNNETAIQFLLVLRLSPHLACLFSHHPCLSFSHSISNSIPTLSASPYLELQSPLVISSDFICQLQRTGATHKFYYFESQSSLTRFCRQSDRIIPYTPFIMLSLFCLNDRLCIGQPKKYQSIRKNAQTYNIKLRRIMGQLSALFYKNWILYKRGVCGNILEFIIPIFFIFFVVLIKRLDPPTTYTEQSFLSNPALAFTINSNAALTSYLKKCPTGSRVGLAPQANTFLTTYVAPLITTAGLTPQYFTAESDLESYVRDQSYSTATQICFALVVDSSSSSYQYKLRFNISQNTGTSDGPSTSLKLTKDQAIDLTLYNNSIYKGMIGATTLMNTAIFQNQRGATGNFLNHKVAPMYQEDYVLDNIYNNLGPTIGILALLPLLLIYLRQTSSMLSQKEAKVRQSMSIMGMKMSNYYISWFFRYFFVYLVLHIICSAIMSSQLKNVPFYIPFIVFILFDIVLIIQNFFIQVFLSRAKIGVVISLLFFVIQYVLSFISTNSDSPSIGVNAGISVIPHAAFIIALQTMIYAESNQITPAFGETLNNYVIGYALASFILNILFYLILTWYLDQVVPNEWGAKKHPLFCCFNKQITTYTPEEKERRKREEMEKPEYISSNEPIDDGLRMLQQSKKMIEIVGLKKQFNGGDTLAVENLNVSMYNNQIFALLGHNGAGKTTTISMLTGMIEPTDGYISVFGETELQKIRETIGVCPQHDTLYEDLTVQEHLELFASFKGLEEHQLEDEVQKLINDVNLRQKKDEYAKNLSGGQKRRLSVAIAFAGRSKVIILDEPTSGMDTSARRYIWELLKTYKNDRIIILTTHFMDEADYLGDRIGIMGEGRMVCCGSSIFLKNRFGVGYNLTFVKETATTDSTALINLIKKYIPNAKVLSNVAADLSVQLPMEDIKHFPNLFKEVDERKAEMKYLQYGISITTLEEVFLRVGEQIQRQHMQHQAKTSNPPSVRGVNDSVLIQVGNSENLQKDLSGPSPTKSPFLPLSEEAILGEISFDEIPHEQGMCTQFWIHFNATFMKRFRVIRRDWKSFIFELILPIIIMIFALLLMRISFITDQSAQTININTYLSQQNPVLVPISSSDTTFTTTMASALSTKYGSTISVSSDTTHTTDSTFDQNYLFPIKKQQKTMKGGIFFTKPASGADTTLQFTTLANTRSPTSYFFLQTLATETFVNQFLSKSISITVINHPLPRTYQQLQINNTISGFFGSFIFSLALAFKFASIISFIVKEREDRSKHQQLVSGMRISAYWISNYLYDLVLYLIIAIVAVGLCQALSITAFTQGTAYLGTCLLFLFYGLAYISFTYIMAFLFKDYGNAQAGFYFLTFIIGGMIPILPYLLRILGSNSNPIGRGISWVLRIYPAFAFGEGLLNMGSGSLYGTYQNNGVKLDPMALQMAQAPIIYLAVESILYFGLLFLIESLMKNENFMRCFTSENNIEASKPIVESDVLEEHEKANSASPEDYEILTKELRKVYMIDSDKKYKVAVDNLSFAVKRGEVFGLLGVNGAGKSTTFKMLAGEVTSTSGQCYFNGLRISDNIDKVRESLGYCPQFDALIENLTVREQLQLFYDLKSLLRQQKDAAITRKIEEMNLKQYEDKLSGTLSGGNKRKLSVAMAMIGNPRIIFLDEPSTGMDPKARRFMWRVISRVATEKKNATVILTTHSMEEAEALSSRLGIMVKGNFQCIGTPQHIKNKYGQGFEIEVKLQPFKRQYIADVMTKLKLNGMIVKNNNLDTILALLEVQPEDRLQISPSGTGNYIHNELETRKKVDIEPLVEFAEICKIHRKIVNALVAQSGEVQILERIQTFIRLKAKKRARVSQLFDFFQRKKQELNIQQYTIKQASVEQIFNRFAESNELSQYAP